MASAKQRVQKGARMLDKYRPGWAIEINISDFNITSPTECIIGQLFGDFSNGVHALRALGASVDIRKLGFMIQTSSIWNGFCDIDTDYINLQKEWVAEINARAQEPLAKAA